MTNFTTKLFMLFLALSSLHVMAQKAAPEFSASIGGGISTLAFQPSVSGKSSIGFSSDIGGGFTGFFSQQVGIYVGAGFGLYNVKTKVSEIVAPTPGMIDQQNNYLYDLTTTLFDYTEMKKSMFVNIPLMFQFQSKIKQYWNWRQTKKAGFYAKGGMKLYLLFNSKYETMVSALKNVALYTELGGVAGTQTFARLGRFDNNKEGWSSEGDLGFGVMAALALETGVKWRIDKTTFLYTGIYFDCGLNDPNKDARVQYKNETKLPKTDLSDLTLLKTENQQRTTLMVVGIKLQFAFTRNQGW